jgi:hypothetical protein
MSQVYREIHYHGSSHHGAGIGAWFAVLAAGVGGLIVTLLGLRFALSLLAVDRAGTVASLVYALSYPFVAPFFALFNYQQQMGVLRFEFQTLVAIVFWSMVAALTIWLLTANPREEDQENI